MMKMAATLKCYTTTLPIAMKLKRLLEKDLLDKLSR